MRSRSDWGLRGFLHSNSRASIRKRNRDPRNFLDLLDSLHFGMKDKLDYWEPGYKSLDRSLRSFLEMKL